MDLQTLPGKSRNSQIYHKNDGFFFYRYKVHGLYSYFRCKEFKDGCPVRVIMRDREAFSPEGIHNHPADFLFVPYLTQREILVGQARNLDIATFQDIFDDPRNSGGFFGTLLTRHSLYPAMSRARASVLPRVQNLDSLLQVLTNPEYACVSATSQFQDSIYCSSVQTEIGLCILFLSNKCRNFMRVQLELVVFESQITEQLRIVSLAWCIVEGAENDEIMCSAFNLLRSALLPSWMFSRVICGGTNVTRALKTVFPQLQVLPSLYDYIQDIKEFIATTLITTDLVRRSTKLREVLNYCCSLPIVPKEHLQFAINCILSKAEIFNGFVKDSLQSLFQHLEIQWLNDPEKGVNFVVCDDMVRTNSNSEDLKFSTNRALRNFNGDFYFIPRYVLSCVNKSHMAIDNIMAGNQANYNPGTKALIEDPQIVQLTMSLQRNPYLVDMFVNNLLSAASEKLGHVNFNLM